MKNTTIILMMGFLSILISCSGAKNSKNKPQTEGEKEISKLNPNEALQGENYYLFLLDTITENIIASKVKADYRPNDIDKTIYVWENTYSAGRANGTNFFDKAEGWTSLIMGSAGWSGCGLFIENEINLTDINEEYSFHVGMKSKDNATHLIIFYGSDDTEARISIGEAEFEGVKPLYNFTRDGEWHEIIIPMSAVFEQGLKYNSVFNGGNLIAFVSNGAEKSTLDVDAAFIYKPLE